MEQDEIKFTINDGEGLKMPATRPKKRDNRSYIDLLLEEIDNVKFQKFRIQVLWVPLRHLLTYLGLLALLLCILFLVGYLLWELVIPDNYSSEKMNIVDLIYWGYNFVTILTIVFVLGASCKTGISIIAKENNII